MEWARVKPSHNQSMWQTFNLRSWALDEITRTAPMLVQEQETQTAPSGRFLHPSHFPTSQLHLRSNPIILCVLVATYQLLLSLLKLLRPVVTQPLIPPPPGPQQLSWEISWLWDLSLGKTAFVGSPRHVPKCDWSQVTSLVAQSPCMTWV